MKKKKPIDGFIPRRPSDELGSLHSKSSTKDLKTDFLHRELHSGGDTTKTLGARHHNEDIDRVDIERSLQDARPNLKNDFPAKKILILILALALLIGLYLLYKLIN